MESREVIKEIRSLLATDTPPEDGIAMRLILAAMSDLLENFDEDHRRIQVMWPAYKGIMWMAGILGLSVVSLIWGLVTGTVTLVMAGP